MKLKLIPMSNTDMENKNKDTEKVFNENDDNIYYTISVVCRGKKWKKKSLKKKT